MADFAGTLDIDDPMAGEVAVRLLSGHELVSSWAAVRMSLEINDTFVSGNGPTSRSASLQLVDNKGVVVATGVANIGGGGGGPGGGGAGGFGGNWFVNLTDTTDQPVRIQVGDTLRATVGDDMFNLVVPELRGVAFVADDLVNGVTSPAKTVGIDVVRPLVGDDATAETVSDGTGNFSHSFSGTFDLQHNDSITFNIDEGGHTILSQIFVPGLRLDLDTGTLVGSWRPLADVAITVLSGGRTLYTGSAKTDVDAIFSVTMVDGTGERVRPKQGDVVRVVPAGASPDTRSDALSVIAVTLPTGMMIGSPATKFTSTRSPMAIAFAPPKPTPYAPALFETSSSTAFCVPLAARSVTVTSVPGSATPVTWLVWIPTRTCSIASIVTIVRPGATSTPTRMRQPGPIGSVPGIVALNVPSAADVAVAVGGVPPNGESASTVTFMPAGARPTTLRSEVDT